MLRSESLSTAKRQALLFQPALQGLDIRFRRMSPSGALSTGTAATAAAAIGLCVAAGPQWDGAVENQYLRDASLLLGQIIDKSLVWTELKPGRPSSTIVVPLQEHAFRVSAVMGLSKSQIAKILGVSRTTLYDWIKGKMEPHGRNAERLTILGNLAAQIRETTERSLYHGFVEKPLPGEADTILSILERDEWDEARLVELFKRASQLTEERSRRVRVGTSNLVTPAGEQDTTLDDNLARLGLG